MRLLSMEFLLMAELSSDRRPNTRNQALGTLEVTCVPRILDPLVTGGLTVRKPKALSEGILVNG